MEKKFQHPRVHQKLLISNEWNKSDKNVEKWERRVFVKDANTSLSFQATFSLFTLLVQITNCRKSDSLIMTCWYIYNKAPLINYAMYDRRKIELL